MEHGMYGFCYSGFNVFVCSTCFAYDTAKICEMSDLVYVNPKKCYWCFLLSVDSYSFSLLCVNLHPY